MNKLLNGELMSEAMQIQWLIEGRIMRVPGSTSTEVMAERNRLVLEAIETEGQPPMVHCLIDHRNQYTAEDLAAQPKLARSYVMEDDELRQKLLSHPMLGWVISIATPNPALKMAASISSQRDKYRWHSVSTFQEALKWLESHDTSLPDLSVLDTYA
jgi:hypothetical protein